nr:ABC transporter ATP-binding protein [uncultured Lichenicoccus sp.]
MPAASGLAGHARSHNLLELRGIEKRYGTVLANAGIDLDVPPGSVVGLLGENGSGKSTLMKILFGVVPADRGGIVFRQQELSGHTPAEAIAAGIGMVHQHFMLFDGMSVAENVLLGLGGRGRLRLADAAMAIRRTSETYGLDLDPAAIVGDLPLGSRQRVEIVKALMRDVQLLILDEPTSNLAPPEVARLLAICSRLRDEGRSIIFISHKLGEVLEICGHIVVLRDGRVVARCDGSASRAELARLMVGRDPPPPLARAAHAAGKPLLALRGIELSMSDTASSGSICFEVREGEILAIAGVDGNGQHELGRSIAGLQRPRAGSIRLGNEDVTRWSVGARVAAGLAYVPADRATTSLVPRLSVAENLMLRDCTRPPFGQHGVLWPSALRRVARAAMAAYAIRARSGSMPAGQLSGGNQQKIVLAREIGRQPRVLVVLQPTWGLDPETTGFVMAQILRLRDAGAAILYISSELDEVLALGDRIGVMAGGRLVDIMERAHANSDRLGLMMGSSAHGSAA